MNVCISEGVMDMEEKLNFKKIAVLLSPLLPFVLLPIPYGWFNSNVLVDWLGCGCPRVDELGNIYEPVFNANDFTALFWLFVSMAVTLTAFVISVRKFPSWNRWLRALYVIAVIAVSLLISYNLYQSMMWS